MKKFLLSFTILMIAGTLATAQDLQLKISAPSQVAVGQPFRVEASVNKQNINIPEPQLSDFQVYGQMRGSSMSFINGNMSVKSSVTYTVAASKTGTFKIPSISVVENGKTFTSNSLTITVVEGNPNAQTNNNNNNQRRNNPFADFFDELDEPAQNNNVPTPSGSGDLFVDINCNKSEVYVGEQIIMSANFYSRYEIVGFEDCKFPKFAGFWAKDIYNPKNISFDRKRIKNATYLYALWQKKALFPQKAGTLEIDPYSIDCIITDGYGFRRAKAVAKSKTKQIKVKPLPTNGKPNNFGGAVGSFTVDFSADKTQVKLDEPLTLHLKVKGVGNFQLFETPAIDVPTAFEKYDTKSSENLTAGDNGISGTKTFSTVIIARQPGEYTIPAVEFSYFDVNSKSYKTVTSKPFTINVSGERDSTAQTYTAITKSEVEELGSDIRFIKKDGIKLKNGKSYFFNSFEFWIIFIVLILAFATIVALRIQQIKNNANIIGLKNRRAGKTSRKRLKQAANFMKDNKKDEFYVEILNALWGYLSDKLAIPVADLSRDNVVEKLTEKGIDEAVTNKFIDVLDTCEFEHYAPESLSHPLNEIYSKAAEAIETMENNIKA